MSTSKPLHALLSSIINQQNNWKFQLLQEWDAILGNLSSFVQLEKIEKDTLILGVSDSCWLQELYLLSPLLLKTINEKLADAPIKQLRFKLSGIKKKRTHHHQPKKEIAAVRIELAPPEKKALERIDDPELRRALEQFLIRCYREK